MPRIFAIDPVPGNLENLRTMLASSFPDLVWLTGPGTPGALEKIRQDAPDLVILAQNGDPETTEAFIRDLRSGPQNADVPLLMTSDNPTGATDRLSLLRAGVDAFLLFPSDTAVVTAQVLLLIRTRQATDIARNATRLMERTVEEKTRLLRAQLEELKNTERDLKKSYAELQTTKLAMLNLMEDLKEEVYQRNQSEQVLKESEHRYETFINSIDDFAFLKDENFKYLFINHANAAFFNRKPEEIIGREDFELMDGESANICRKADMEAIRGNRLVVGEEMIGDHIYESRKFPVLLRDGRIGVGGYIRDITDRKAAEVLINRMNDELEHRVRERTAQLEAANRELEAFSYSVSHDLRAPLRAIDGFSRILTEDYKPLFDDEGKRLCAVIQENAIRMGQLIDDLLALSRLNRTEMRLATINMETLAREVYQDIATAEERSRTRFSIGRVHRALADQVLLKQVVVNLVTNAVKFTSKSNHAEITFSSELKDGYVVYCLRDNGAGFDMKYAGKLFGAFQRLHSVRDYEGNGIGLAIVQRIIHRHGGEVWAEGEVGKGAAFYFSLPLEPQTLLDHSS